MLSPATFPSAPPPRLDLHRWLLALLAAALIPSSIATGFAQDPASVPTPAPVPEEPAIPAVPSAPETPASPEARTSKKRKGGTKKNTRHTEEPEVVRIGEPVHIRAGETRRKVVVVQSSATIDGDVEEDVVVVGGNARINGSVGGNVVSVGGGIHLGRGAQIDGDAVGVLGGIRMAEDSVINGNAVGIVGGVERAEGATVNGKLVDQSFPFPPFGGLENGTSGVPKWIEVTFRQVILKFRLLSFAVGWVWIVAALFLGLYVLIAVVAPRVVVSVGETLRIRGATAFLMGLLALPLGALVTLFLIVSGIGILVIPFLAAAFLLAAVAGKAGMLHYLGCAVFRKEQRIAAPAVVLLAGALVLSLLYLIPFVGIFSWAVFSMWGLGAALLALLAKFRRETQPPAKQPLAPAPAAPQFKTPPVQDPSPATPAPVGETPSVMAVALTGSAPAVTGLFPESSAASAPVPPSSEPQSEGTPNSLNAGNLPPPSPMIVPPTVQPDLLTLPRVGLKERLLATALDWFLIEVVLSTLHLNGARATFIGGIAYFAGFWIWRQTTLGGILLRLKVVRLDGRPVDAPTALVRSLGATFGTLALGLGYFWSAWDADRQGWHDKISGTVVVRTPGTQPLV